MKTARDEASDILRAYHGSDPSGAHAAIERLVEARDAEHAAALAEKTETAGKLANDYLANMNFRAHVGVELSDLHNDVAALTVERDRLREALRVATRLLGRWRGHQADKPAVRSALEHDTASFLKEGP